MPLPKLRIAERRIGIVGLYASGKTVFLTSLIDHLRHHSPGGDFRLGRDGRTRIRKFTPLEPENGWQRFPYETARKRLVHGEKWPEKSTERMQFACSFERSDWYSRVNLKIYDLPGERIADVPMAGRDFAEWSEVTLTRFRSDKGYEEQASQFLSLLKEPGSLREQLTVRAYKHALAELALRFKGYVSPSSFLLDQHGSYAIHDSTENLVRKRFVGLDEEHQFAPLPPDASENNPELYRTFRKRYRAYRDKIATPIAAALKRCHGLIVLVDIPMLLTGGVGMYNDNKQMITGLLNVLNPGQGRTRAILNRLGEALLPHQWRPSAITRLAFAAGKVDRVHPMDRDRVLHLLKRMVRQPAEDIDGAKVGFWNCCAVKSTEAISDTERRLCAVLDDGHADEERKYTVSEVPEDWPLSWEPGTYSFPSVRPKVPQRIDSPPRQQNLDRILDFVMR